MKTSHIKITSVLWNLFFAAVLSGLTSNAWALADKTKPSPSELGREQWLSQMSVLVASEITNDEKIKEALCPLVVGIAKQVAEQKKATVPCLTFSLADFNAHPPKGETFRHFDSAHAVNVLIWQDLTSDWHIYAVNSLLKDPSDVRHGEWKIDGKDPKKAREVLERLLINVFAYYQNLRSIKEFALVAGLEESKLIKQIAPGEYARIDTGESLSFNQAYDLYLSESKRTKYYLAAALEVALLLGGGLHWYNTHHDINVVDWEFTSDSRIGHRLKLDDNDPTINIHHITKAGTGYYLAARIAGLNPLESFLTAFAASAIWEWKIEHQEVFSINDQIVTPVGGAILGEAMYQVGLRVWQKFSKMSNQKLMNAYGKGGFFDRLRQDFAYFSRQDLRSTGLDFDMPASGEAGLAAYKMRSNGETDVRYYLDSEGYNIPLMNAPGDAKRVLADVNYFRLFVEASKDPKAQDTLNLIAETAMAGYYYKKMGADANGNPVGYSFLVAPAQAVNMSVDKASQGQFNDMVVNVNVLGSTLHINGQAKGVSFRIVMSVYGDFAMVQSYAFESYAQQNNVSGAPSVLRDQGYYYAGGVTGAMRVAVKYGPLEVGGNAAQDQFRSVLTGSYRDEDKVTFNPTLRDQQTRAEVYGKVSLAKTLNLKCGLAVKERSGSLNDYEGEKSNKAERYQYCAMTYSFL